MDIRQEIMRILENHPSGIGPKQIQDELVKSGLIKNISPPSIRRYLTSLVKNGDIVTEGYTNARIYKLRNVMHQDSQLPSLSMTSEAKEIQELICRPIMHRNPVGYNAKFLLDYKPNQSFYLSSNQRMALHAMGRSNMEERPAGTYARDILSRLLVDLSWASSYLEGNTYTVLDTKRLIEEGIKAPGKNTSEAQMILNHKRAIELIVEDAELIGFNGYTLKNIHATLSEGLMPDPLTEGRLRTRVVEIEGSVFHPLPMPQQIEEYFQVMLEKAELISDPYEQSFFIMVQLPYLQPFEDVNKRVSRLAANIPFVKFNLCPLSFMDVPNDLYIEGLLGIYELNRIDLIREVFMWAYNRSCQLYPLKKAQLVQPDPLKLKHRELIQQLVRLVVTRQLLFNEDSIRNEIQGLGIPDSEIQLLINMVNADLTNLHEGNFARYGIRPREFAAWESR